jgi:general secretion pathway protein A
MYLEHYGLTAKPFNPTPDPKFLYLSSGHREALAQLQYGIQERRGFLLLTGEVGTGKTTLLQMILQQLDAATEAAFIFNSGLPFTGLLEYMLEDFGIARSTDSEAQQLFALNHFLTERRRAGQNTVLILDEAQNLSVATLEQVRMLSNFETATEKLLQILIVGQPELRGRLKLAELRQLNQRIGIRCAIHALKTKDTGDYIRHRLRIAGAPSDGIFAETAIREIADYARGVPRTINLVCDHALLIGYADQSKRIDARIAREAIAYLEDDGVEPAAEEPSADERDEPDEQAPLRVEPVSAAERLEAAIAEPEAVAEPATEEPEAAPPPSPPPPEPPKDAKEQLAALGWSNSDGEEEPATNHTPVLSHRPPAWFAGR